MIKFKIMNKYIENLRGKDIALKAIEYAKDKNPNMKAFIRQASTSDRRHLWCIMASSYRRTGQ